MKTYENAFQKNIQFLKGKTKDLTLQELLDGAKKEQSLSKIEHTKEETYQEHKSKWKCFDCNIGVMKIVIVPRHDGKFFIRCCNNEACKRRTDLKPFNEKVEIS